MSKKLPMKYVAGYIAKIYYRKYDKWAHYYERHGTEHYFDTWQETKDFMIADTKKKIARLEKDLASEKRHLDKVLKMEEPISCIKSEKGEAHND